MNRNRPDVGRHSQQRLEEFLAEPHELDNSECIDNSYLTYGIEWSFYPAMVSLAC